MSGGSELWYSHQIHTFLFIDTHTSFLYYLPKFNGIFNETFKQLEVCESQFFTNLLYFLFRFLTYSFLDTASIALNWSFANCCFRLFDPELFASGTFSTSFSMTRFGLLIIDPTIFFPMTEPPILISFDAETINQAIIDPLQMKQYLRFLSHTQLLERLIKDTTKI